VRSGGTVGRGVFTQWLKFVSTLPCYDQLGVVGQKDEHRAVIDDCSIIGLAAFGSPHNGTVAQIEAKELPGFEV
jgi:hypothetical protein